MKNVNSYSFYQVYKNTIMNTDEILELSIQLGRIVETIRRGIITIESDEQVYRLLRVFTVIQLEFAKTHEIAFVMTMQNLPMWNMSTVWFLMQMRLARITKILQNSQAQ